MIAIFKKTIPLLFLIVFISCGDTILKDQSLDLYIPENPSVVFKINNFDALKGDILNNSLTAAMDKTGPYKFLSKKALLLKYIKPTSESILSVNKIDDSSSAYTFITRENQDLFNLDSLPNKIVETLSYSNKSIQRITIDQEVAFIAIKDSVFIATSSEQLLQNILDDKVNKATDFRKIYNLNHSGDFTTILPADNISLNGNENIRFASYFGLDVVVLPDAINATGVALARDTIPQLLSVFNGQIPQQNDIANIIPVNTSGVISFTFNDAELLTKNLATYRGSPLEVNSTGILASCNEVGQLTFKDGNAVVIKSIDPELTNVSLAPFISESSLFRDVTLFKFNKPEFFTNTFAPLISESSANYIFQIDNFFVFTETEATAQEIISAFKSNNTLSKSSYFDASSSQLSNASSLLFYGLNGNLPQLVSAFFDEDSATGIDKVTLEDYPFSALQFSYDRDFAHINFVCNQASENKKTTGRVSEQFSVTLENQILTNPQLFSNHRTKGEDVVVQDMANHLYLISASGKILWKQKLDSPILGEIQEIDILRNGKKQLAFATEKIFYVLDRTGKPVAPFPIKFKDPITQPLAVFDYDKNRKYRFIIVQDKEVLMYDSDAKIVKGFTFTKAKSKIVLAPQHIRMSNKDYILIAEESGKLNILSRVGKSRVDVSKKFSFSEMPIAKEANNFVVITTDDIKHSISQSGKVSTTKLDVSEGYSFTISGSTKVTLNENLLRINGKLVELPFGIYTRPRIFTANKAVYISVTETQENKVYVYNKAGTLLFGLPVYGTSDAVIGNITSKNRLGIVVRGAENEILCYSIQ